MQKITIKIGIPLAALILFCYFEHQYESGILISVLITLILYFACHNKLSLVCLAVQFFLLEVGFLYQSYIPFLLLELIIVTYNNPRDDSLRIKTWRPFEKEIRSFLLSVDSSVLHRVDDLLDNNKNEEKELLEYLKYLYNENSNEYEKQELIRKLFYSTKKIKKLSSFFQKKSISPAECDRKITRILNINQICDGGFDATEIKEEIRNLLKLKSPSLNQYVDRMLRDYHGKEKELLDKLHIELGCNVSVTDQNLANDNNECSISIDNDNRYSHVIRNNEDYDDTSSSSRGRENTNYNRSNHNSKAYYKNDGYGSKNHHIISENHSINKDYKSPSQLTQSGLSSLSLSSPIVFNSGRYRDSSSNDDIYDIDSSSGDYRRYHNSTGTKKYEIDNNLNFCHLNVIE